MAFIEMMIQLVERFGSVFLQGTLVTLGLAFATVLFGAIFGSLLSLIKLSKNKVLQLIATVYVEIIRGTPLLLQLYFFYYGIPMIFGGDIPKELCVVMALVINSSAYVAEIIRSGIQAVDKGQKEAAKSLGLSDMNTMIKIILPQAVKNILPALGNEFIMVIKETSLAAVFFVGDLMTSFNTVNAVTFRALETLMVIGIIYFILTFSLSKVVQAFERRLAQSD